MARASLPPYFAAVALASTLVCGALAAFELSRPTVTEDALPHQTSTDASTDTEASIDNETPGAPARPVAYTRTFSFKRLAHDVIVEGSPLRRKRIRRRLRAFRDTVRAAEDAGIGVGFFLRDLETGAQVSYNADQDFYPASSIKGPYVVCVYERLVDTGALRAKQVDGIARNTIANSDNDAYHALINLCGTEVIAEWAVNCGAIERDSDEYRDFASRYYPRVTPRQLARMWEHMYAYLNDASGSGPKLTEMFIQRVESPLRAGLREDITTIAKAGWYPSDNGDAFAATVDAGIVLDGTHTYVMVLMTTLPDNLGSLAEMVPGIWRARRTLG